VERPFTLIAELTYRCPLACAYCSNPSQYPEKKALNAAMWSRIFREGEALGIVQVNITGGEPLLRDDLEAMITEAARLSLYVNLITGGYPLNRDRLATLRDCGLNSVQLSIQAAEREYSDRIAGMAVYDHKLAAAQWITDLGLPLTVNVVLHRHNLHEVGRLIRLAERLGAQRLELANVQYLGWALTNRAWLLPKLSQLEEARAVAEEARARLSGIMELVFVTPDYYSGIPRACMDGWGRRYIVVTPDGLVLPCHAAHTIPDLPMVSATDWPLHKIWEESELFNLFRGTEWMHEPCRSCERRWVDFGGCRCQAFHVAGLPEATDPVCRFSPDHYRIEQARQGVYDSQRTLLKRPRVLRGVP